MGRGLRAFVADRCPRGRRLAWSAGGGGKERASCCKPSPEKSAGCTSARRRRQKRSRCDCSPTRWSGIPASPFSRRSGTGTTRSDICSCQFTGTPTIVVLDEFPFLSRVSSPPCRRSSSGNSAQEELGFGSSVRLVLCGSAMSVMGGLLAGRAPLRGRAGLELVVQPFRYRDAATFWSIADPRLALMVHSVVGGTPAYGREFVRSDTPSGPDDFDAVDPAYGPQSADSALPRGAGTCSPRRPTSGSLRSITPCSPRSPPATPPTAASPATSGARSD